mgnify:CR=1 FL=1
MSNILNNFYVQSNKPLDKKWGPYNSIEECLKILISETEDENSGEKLSGVRYQGLTVGILQKDKTIKEYWFKDGIEDKHLVEKTIELPENTDNGLPEGYYIATFLYDTQHMNSILTDYDGFIKLPENQFVNDGHKISGWQIDNDDKIFEIGENIKLSQNTIFIPIWEVLKEYKITIRSYDTEIIESCDENDTIQIVAEDKEGYSFIKWDDGNTENPRLITVTEDKDYIAIFSENWYVVPGDFNNNNFEIKDEDLFLVNENPVIIPSKNFNNGNGIILIPKKLSAEYFNFIDTMGNTVEMEKVDKPPVTSNTQVYTKLNENDNQIEKQINGLNYIGYGICIGSNTFTGIEIKTKLNNVEK